MMTPQLTEQYGQVERVSFARAIRSVRSCAYAGLRSKPNTAAATPPTVVSFRKSRRGGCTGPPFPKGGRASGDKGGQISFIAAGVKSKFLKWREGQKRRRAGGVEKVE